MADDVVIEGDETPDGDTIVTVVTDDGGSSDDLATGVLLGQISTTLESLVSRVDEIDSRTSGAQATADVALDVAVSAADAATEAVEEVEEVAEEVEEETPETTSDDTQMITPDRDHALWRKPIKIGGRH